jgi:inhibitor of Bruton tyrosine kinase
MSGYLWKYYLEDDVARFRHVLETASYSRAGTQKGHTGGQANIGLGIGSPGSLAASPTLTAKGRKGPDPSPAALTLTRGDINHRDSQGRTLLHLAASSTSENAFEFATLLLDHPLTDIYLQDPENGWTPLHRAFYAGNISTAHSILARDSQDAFGRGAGAGNHQAGGLIKIKDKEGNGPLDLFEMTLQDTDGSRSMRRPYGPDDSDDDSESIPDNSNMDGDTGKIKDIPFLDLNGDEVYTFGSNKNVTLGFGDEDDRQFPERITLRRPHHLYFRFYEEHLESLRITQNLASSTSGIANSEKWLDDLPSVIRSKPIRIQDVQMSKLHTAILTTDPESNLYICGHGSGGRIGIGDETTRFQFVCVEGGGLAHKKVAAVALGQNHTLAISNEGEIFSWGSNSFGQLGYAVPRSRKNEEPVQPVPRQIYGPLKRETIVGIAASRLHSVVHTSTALFTFGKNEGQLGIVDSDARSTEIQDIPRRVGASLFPVPIKAVSAIDRATTCLLENHEVWVFANYGYARVPFPLDGFTNYFLQSSIWATKYDSSPNRIVKVVSGGDTICAMSNSGEVFTVTLSQPTATPVSFMASTTNPRQIKGALSQPLRVWSNKKSHLAARDVDVDQNGSIILVTQAGGVWRRVKRAKIKDASAAGTGEYKQKDYKYSRISGLTRVTAVRASGFGAYAAIREDCTKTRDIPLSEKTLASDIAKLSPLDFSRADDTDRYMAHLRIPPKLLSQSITQEKMDEYIKEFILHEPRSGLDYDMVLCTSTSKVQIPIHSFVLAGRSKILRQGLERFREDGVFVIPDLLTARKGDNDKTEITFHSLDILTLIYLILSLYNEQAIMYSVMLTLPIPGVKNSQRHRQAQRDLLKAANKLEMKQLATAIDKSTRTTKLDQDMEQALEDPAFFANANVLVVLSDDEVPVHGALICQRCPFFEGLFKGRAGGQWLADRRQGMERSADAVRIDLSHVESKVFQKVLRHIYADTGEELFDDVVAEDLDAFLDQVIEVLEVANELMLRRLSEICQRVIGKYGR